MRLRSVQIALLVLLPLSFYAGYRANRGPAAGKAGPDGRKILDYVDPMSPSFQSMEPGIAPCRMPLQPVYADSVAQPGGGMASGAIPVRPNGRSPGTGVGGISRISCAIDHVASHWMPDT